MMEWWEREAQNLMIEKRLGRLERRALRAERCKCRNCGALIHYSAPDTVYVHEDGSYYCEPPPNFSLHASP